MSTAGRELLRTVAPTETVVPMAAILVLGGLLAWAFGATPPPLDVVGEPLAELTKGLALALAIVHGVRAER